MSRPQLSDFSPRVQAQIAAQLYATPRPRTVAIEACEPVRAPTPLRRKRETPDATEWLVAQGIPKPVREHRFHAVRKWRYDYAWPDDKVALEVEGGAWTQGRHTRGSGFLADMTKYNAAAADGWCVLRCTPKDLRSQATVALLRQALGV
jgi:very-short-patch-repair endonuclease